MNTKCKESNFLSQIEKITIETEDGKEIATILNDEIVDTPMMVAEGYVARFKPFSN